MADKLTQQIVDALGKAAAGPSGLPLFAGKIGLGLFPSTVTAKAAAQKCLADGFIQLVGTEIDGKAARELYGLTDRGWEFLIAAVNPKQVLEDFVRVLEARQGEVGELLGRAREMAESLHGLKEAVTRVLPQVSAIRIPHPDAVVSEELECARSGRESLPHRREVFSRNDISHREDSVAVVSGSPLISDLSGSVLSCLFEWAATATAGEDCPLPELFRGLSTRKPAPTIGEFHDCLRELHGRGSIYLHPWTGPLYALPEPAFALLAGHNVAFYASVKGKS